MNRKDHPPAATAAERKAVWTQLVQTCQVVLGVDARSLALFRMGTAVVLLLDLWYRSRDLAAFFTDRGILPRHVLLSLNEMGAEYGFEHTWSLHMFSGQYWGQLLLILSATWFAGWLLVGYRTRLAAAVSWVLLVSLDFRNPDILNSGDVLLRSMLFWSLFLPLGGVWSLDRLIKRPQPASLPVRFTSIASAALLLQLAMMYFFSAIHKWNPVWYSEFSGVYYALHCDAYTKPLGLALREYAGLMKILTAGAFGLELIGGILVFLPFWNSRVRIVLVALFWTFHLGLGVTMTLGLFPIICIVSWTVFLPGEFWEWLAVRLGGFERKRLGRFLVRMAVRLRRRTKESAAFGLALAEAPRWQCRGPKFVLTNTVLAAVLVYLLLWNVRELDVGYWEKRILPVEANALGRALGLDQNWGMFAPIPRTQDGWIVMKGTLRDGSEVNLWQPDQPLPWDKPQIVSAVYRSQRWRKYLDNLSTDAYALRRLDFCEWLGRQWNARLDAGETERKVVLIELVHRIEATPPPGEAFPELESRFLYEYRPLYYD